MYRFKELEKYANEINKKLEIYYKNKTIRIGSRFPIVKKINNIINEFILRGGKRIRPFLVYCGYKCIGGKNKGEILNASLCLELLQSFLLIHDDIVDKSEVRRGGLTVHKKIEKKYIEILGRNKAKEFGTFLAIWIGNLCYIDSFQILSNSKFPQKNIIIAIQELSKILELAIHGQIMDIFAGTKVVTITEKDINIIQELKTGKYTIEAPLLIGAVLGGGSSKDIDMLKKYARPLGRAFQIKDDINGLFGNPQKTGKPNDSDLKMGKMTLLIVKALKSANRYQKKVILNCLGNKNIKLKDVENIKNIIIQTGAFKYSEHKIKKLIKKAKNIIQKSKFNKKGENLLLKMANFIEASKY